MNKVDQACRRAAAILKQEREEIHQRWLARLEAITLDAEPARIAIAANLHVPLIIALLSESLEGEGLSGDSEELQSLSQFVGRQVLRDNGSVRVCIQAQRLLQTEMWASIRRQICSGPNYSFEECINVKEHFDVFMDDLLAGMMEGGAPWLGGNHQYMPEALIEGLRGASASGPGCSNEEYCVLGSVEALAAALDAKDSSTRHHSERTAHYAATIAKRMGFRPEEIEELRHIALLHDVGKIGIHDSVITKPGYLTVAERDLMRLHPTIGASILARAQILDRMVPPVLHHHEWVDGTGYPAGLKGDKIPLQSRVLGVADAFDAMTSERTYRPRRSLERAASELHAKSGIQFDPDVVRAFEDVVDEFAPMVIDVA